MITKLKNKLNSKRRYRLDFDFKDDNWAMCACLLKHGFRQIGIIKNGMIDDNGEYYDMREWRYLSLPNLQHEAVSK
jgi:RimJ/RimL family protein N-acetyltransferase